MSFSSLHSIELWWAKHQFRSNTRARRRLWNKLAKMIGNGVPILQALESLRKRRIDAGAEKHPTTVALTDWCKKLSNGDRLATALREWVDNDEQMLISAGEQAGEMERSLHSAARVMEARSQIRSALVGGLAYPGFLVLLAFGGLYLFGYKIVPAFTAPVRTDPWHGMARLIVDASAFVQDWLVWMIAALFAVTVAFLISLPRWATGRTRVLVDRYPPYSIYRVLQGSTWLIAFSALVESGMRVEAAMEQLSRNATPWMRTRIDACLRGMRSGYSVGDSLARSGYEFPDREIIDDLGVYSSLSGFDTALGILGREWLTESVEAIRRLMMVVFGIGIAIVGVQVIFMVMGLFALQMQLLPALKQGL